MRILGHDSLQGQHHAAWSSFGHGTAPVARPIRGKIDRHRPRLDPVVTSRARRPQLHALTGLRFFAALYVVTEHYARFALAKGPRLVASFNLAGPVAVSLFFILSGVVLTYSSTDTEGRFAGSKRAFWYARWSRLYPLFLIAIVFSLPANAALLRHSNSTTMTVVWTVVRAGVAVLLLQAWIPNVTFAANAPGWSLSVEAFFYLSFPSLVHRFRCTTLRRLLAFTAPLWLLSIAPAAVLEYVDHHGGLQGTNSISFMGEALTPAVFVGRLAAEFPLARLAEFCIGICLGHFLIAQAANDLSPTIRRRLSLAGLLSIAALVVALTIVGDLRQPNETVIMSGFAAPLFAVLLIALALGSGSLVSFLSSRPLLRLGAASYALYIIQAPFEWWWQKIKPLDVARPAGLTLFLVAIVATALACERWIEVPARQWLLARNAAPTRAVGGPVPDAPPPTASPTHATRPVVASDGTLLRRRLALQASLPDDTIEQIKRLREALATETDPVERHAIYAALLEALTRCVAVFPSASAEYAALRAQREREHQAHTIVSATDRAQDRKVGRAQPSVGR